MRDKYRRASEEDLPRDVAEVVARNAADEVKHYSWACETMETMGAGQKTTVGKVEGAFETIHARTADAIESADRKAIEQAQRVRDGVQSASRRARSGGLAGEVQRVVRSSPAIALALGLAAGVILRRVLR